MKMFRIVFILLNISGFHLSVTYGALYTSSDDVLSLTVKTFNATVLNKPHAFLVEFYSSWCGHCVRYAPRYKQLASDIKGKTRHSICAIY